MAEKKFLSWVGFKSEEETPVRSESTPALSQNVSNESASSSNIARIRELESQLADLRSRRDLTSLTKEEFEILASETAMTLIRTAQSRENKAKATAQKVINDSNRLAREALEVAESRAKSILSQAETRGRKYIEAAENDAQARLNEVERELEKLVNSKKREAAAVTGAAKREAEELVSGAVNDIAEYRSWLSAAVSEAERLHKIQAQSLSAAEQAIEQTRQRLASAFEKLASLQGDLDINLDEENRPVSRTYQRRNGSVVDGEKKASTKKAATRKTVAKKSAAKKSTSKKAPANSQKKRK